VATLRFTRGSIITTEWGGAKIPLCSVLQCTQKTTQNEIHPLNKQGVVTALLYILDYY